MRITLQFDEDGDCWIKKNDGKYIEWINPIQLAEAIMEKELSESLILVIEDGILALRSGDVQVE